MHARVTTFEMPGESWDPGIALINEQVIPGAKQMPGFLSGYWLGDRGSGRVMTVTVFQSLEDVQASEESARQLREGASQQLGGKVVSVEVYEVMASV